MSFVCYVAAVIFFFFAAVGVAFIPAPQSWGLVLFALGHIAGGPYPWKQG